MNKILVIGSSNNDIIVTMNHFPKAGETLEGNSLKYAMGGKGANQAVAACRTGGNVAFITSLGNDEIGNRFLHNYKKEGLSVTYSMLIDNETTGTAMIWVDKNGENSIVIIPGANEKLSSDYIIDNHEVVDSVNIVLLQMEIPYETVKTICKIATRKQKKIILNVAPAYKIETEILKLIDILVVNEIEAEIISGESFEDVGEDAIVNKLLELGVHNVILTLGNKGCLFKNANDFIRIPAFSVDVVDTTAAGDTFCGALATGISNNWEMKKVLEFASAAAALCVTKLGAQPSIPTKNEVNDFLERKNYNN